MPANNENIPAIGDRVGIAWTTQRLANRFPTWSRAREREDSLFQLFTNPIGRVLDEIYSKLFQTRANCFVPTADTNAISDVYVFQLPLDFEFDTFSQTPGSWIWQNPTLGGLIGTTAFQIKILENWDLTDKFYLPPTRISASYVSSNVEEIIVPTTSVWNLASVNLSISFQFDKLASPVYVDIDSANTFGGETSRGEIAIPKVTLTGEPIERDFLDTYTENIIFNSNAQLPSKNAWSYLQSISVNNIFGDNATVTVTRGFNKDALTEPYGLLTEAFQEGELKYQFKNFVYGTNTYPLLQYVVPELSEVELVASGYDERELFYEKLLLDSSGQVIKPIIAIERMPFSPWVLVLTAEKLHVYPISRGHCISRQLESPSIHGGTVDTSKLGNILLANRSHQIELKLNADRTWLHLSEDIDTGIELFTRHISRQRPIQKVRFSYYHFPFDAAWDDEPTRVYIDNTGTIIPNIQVHPTNGWIATPTDKAKNLTWQDLRFTINPLLNGVTSAVYVLEVDASGIIQYDSMLIHADDEKAMASFDLPAEVLNTATGMMYNHLDELLIRRTDKKVYKVNLFWDYATIDYQQNTIYLREEYDEVSAESSTSWPAGSSSPAASVSSTPAIPAVLPIPIGAPISTPSTVPSVWETLTP